MNYSKGDVVLLPYPFTDLTTAKVRPAVVVASEEGKYADLFVVPLTSRTANLKYRRVCFKGLEQCRFCPSTSSGRTDYALQPTDIPFVVSCELVEQSNHERNTFEIGSACNRKTINCLFTKKCSVCLDRWV